MDDVAQRKWPKFVLLFCFSIYLHIHLQRQIHWYFHISTVVRFGAFKLTIDVEILIMFLANNLAIFSKNWVNFTSSGHSQHE